MTTVEENIEILSHRMMDDANSDAEKILADARVKADEIRSKGQSQAEAERKAILDSANREVERLRSQALATTELKARNEQLEFREKLLDKIFEAAREKISTVQQWNNYEEIAVALLKEGLIHLKDYPVRVRVDPAIKKLISEADLQKIATDLGVKITEYSVLSQGTGLVIETMDGHLIFDNSLEVRLDRMQNALRSSVYHILLGEKV